MPRFGCIALLALFMGILFPSFVPITAFAGDVPLTEDQVIALFYQRNLDLIAARYNVDAARAQRIIAAAIPNPVLSLYSQSPGVAAIGRRSGYAGAQYDTVARLEQLIETAGKRGLRKESSGFALQASENDLRDAVRVLSSEVRHAYYNLLLSQKVVDLARETLARYDDIVRTNSLRLESGDIAESDFLRVEVERFKAQGDLDQALRSLTGARTGLAVLLAWPGDAMNFAAQDVSLKRSEVDAKQPPEAFIDQALMQRADLQAARLRVNQAEKALALARARRIPDVTIAVQDEACPFCYPNADNAIGLGVSVPLPVFYRNQGEIALAEVNLNNFNLQVQQLEQNVRAEVLGATVAWRTADAQARRFEDDVIGRVKTVRRAAELAYSKGATGILDFIEAQRSYKNSVLEYQNALYNRAVAYADLVKVMGAEQTPLSPSP